MSDAFLRILSPLPLSRQQDGARLLRLWADNAPQFLPDRWGNYEPVRRHFSLELLDDVLRKWTIAVQFKRVAAPKLDSVVTFGGAGYDEHAEWCLSLKRLQDFDQRSFTNLLEASAIVFSADLGIVHRITEAEVAKGMASRTISDLDIVTRTQKHLFLCTRHLRSYLPDIYWTTVFGKAYVDLFSRQKLLSCPAHRVKELENGSIVVQLTPTLQDTATDEAGFERTRQEARRHLGEDAFFDLAKGPEHKYRVPEFVWGPVLH